MENKNLENKLNSKEYDGIRIDTHTFMGKLDGLLIKDDTAPFFKIPQFNLTRFIPILLNPYQSKASIDTITGNPRFLGCKLIFSPNPKKPYGPYDDPSELKEALKYPDVVGLKVHPPYVDTPLNDDKFSPFYEIASETAIPLLVHCSASGTKYNSAEMIEQIYTDFPDLKLILAHLGGNNPKYMREAVDLADKFPNLHLNTTAIDPYRVKFSIHKGVRTRIPVKETREEVFEIFSDALRRVPNKILFGTDLGYYKPQGIDDDPEAQYPTWPIDVLSSEDQRRILVENPLRVYNKIVRNLQGI